MSPTPRNNITIYWSDPELWGRVQQAAREAGSNAGRNVSASEWLAQAAEERIRRESRTPQARTAP